MGPKVEAQKRTSKVKKELLLLVEAPKGASASLLLLKSIGRKLQQIV